MNAKSGGSSTKRAPNREDRQTASHLTEIRNVSKIFAAPKTVNSCAKVSIPPIKIVYLAMKSESAAGACLKSCLGLLV